MAGITRPTYVIDTSALMDFHGYNTHSAYTADAVEKERVWLEIEDMIRESRLVTVRAVWPELQRYVPECCERLKLLRKTFVKADTAELLIRAGQLVELYPTLVPDLNERPNTREPADPYIIAYAELFTAQIVTSEKHKWEVSRHKNNEHIPDVCDALGLNEIYHSVHEFVQIEFPL